MVVEGIMGKRKFVLTVLLVILSMSCDKVPNGFTKDQWNQLKLQDGKKAQILEWIAKDSKRARVRDIVNIDLPTEKIPNGADELNVYIAGICMNNGKDFPSAIHRIIKMTIDSNQEQFAVISNDIAKNKEILTSGNAKTKELAVTAIMELNNKKLEIGKRIKIQEKLLDDLNRNDL
jgi:hypothetical protein